MQTKLSFFRAVLVYIVLATWIIALMDWKPIHAAWWSQGKWPTWAGASFTEWSRIRSAVQLLLCPICAPLAENYYFVLMEIESGEEEQHDLLLKNAPYSGNPLLPDGPRYWWGQGEGREWRPVSMIALYLYFVPYQIVWWYLYGRRLIGRFALWLDFLAGHKPSQP